MKVLGRAQVGGHAVGLHVVDARQHMHLIGKTGVGKSTLLLNMILGRHPRPARRRGHRPARGPGHRHPRPAPRLLRPHRIAIIDPDQPNPACFNPLDDARATPHLAVDNIVGIFAKIFQRHWGPRMDDTLRVSCLTLMRHANPTLALVPPLLQRPAVPGPVHRTAWTIRRASAGSGTGTTRMNEGLRAQVIGPVLARLRAFLLRDFVKNVIGTPHTSFADAADPRRRGAAVPAAQRDPR